MTRACELLDIIEQQLPEAHAACAELRRALADQHRLVVDLRAQVSLGAAQSSRRIGALCDIVGTPPHGGQDVWDWLMAQLRDRVDRARQPCGCDRCGGMWARLRR